MAKVSEISSQSSSIIGSSPETPPLPPPSDSLTAKEKLPPAAMHTAVAQGKPTNSSPVVKTSPNPGSTESPGQKVNLHLKALNAVLEYALHATLQDPSMKMSIDDDHSLYRVNIEAEEINSNNISEVICSVLTEQNFSDNNGAIGYLTGCYRRLLSKEGTLVTEKIRDEFNSCKRQIVSFIASSMMVPEMFDQNSANSIDNFARLLLTSSDAQAVMLNSLLRDLVEELTQQGSLDDIIGKITDILFDAISVQPTQGIRSVMDDYSSMIAAIRKLASCDKRVSSVITQHEKFLLSAQLRTSEAPSLPPMMINDPRAIERYGVRGAAVPNATILGIILRSVPDLHDREMHRMFGEAHRQSGQIIQGHMTTIRKILISNQTAAAEIILALLKAGNKSKEITLQWIIDAVSLNREAEKGQPSPLLAANSRYLTNLGAVMLQLCRPIVTDIEKIKKIEWEYIGSEEGSIIYPADVTKIFITEADARSIPLSSASFNFITQSFFLCWRALHLGVVKLCDGYINELRRLEHYRGGLDTNDPQAVFALISKIITDAQLLEPTLIQDLMLFCSAAATAFVRFFDTDQASKEASASWLVQPHTLSSIQLRILKLLPEHLIDDLLSILLLIGRVDPPALSKAPLDSMLSLIIFFLRRPWAVKSPHLRAMFGLVLMQVYLPSSEKSPGDYWTHQSAIRDGPHSNLLLNHSDCQHFLAPALLLLYGDVERTGFYDKLTNRRSIMIVLKHLWTLPTHRSAFRGIVSSFDEYDASLASSITMSEHNSQEGPSQSSSTSQQSQNYFVRFANGMMNEANSLVASTMEKLSEIKKIQDDMKSADWNRKSEDERKQIMEKYEQSERECRGSAGLCLETLNMLTYLTSDEVIREPFVNDDSILSQFIDTLLSVLFKLIGPKSLEIKVDNMESYNFQPKPMLREIAMAMLNFADIPKFQRAVRMNTFYKNDKEFRKAIDTIHRLHLLQPAEEEKLNQLIQAFAKIEDYVEALKTLENEAPDEFLDALMFTIMKDPVLLPTSQSIVDRATISRQLLNNEIGRFLFARQSLSNLMVFLIYLINVCLDPFNRKPLKMDMVIPQPELKERISSWLQSKLGAQFSLSDAL